MYKLILVDDESEIRQGLMEVIPFEELGFQVVGEAANGLEALSLCESLRPDLMMTDIRMPLMDGLTLCKRVRDLYPTTQFIILSGYDDYEYVKKAIEAKTMSYLLKPISAAEFCEVLKETKIKLDEEFAQRRDVEKLRSHLKDSLPLLKESLLASLFSGAIKKERALSDAARYDMNLDAKGYLCALSRTGWQYGPDMIADADLLMFSVMNILSEILTKSFTAHLFHYNGMLGLLLLLESIDAETVSRAQELIKEARDTVDYYLQCPLNIGIGSAVPDLDKVAAGAEQALLALEQCIIDRDGNVLGFSDIRYGYQADITADDRLLRQLSNMVKLGEYDEALSALKELMGVCRGASLTAKAYQAYLMEIFITFVRIVPEMTLERTDFNEGFDQFSRKVFLDCPPVEEAERLLTGLLKTLVDAVLTGRKTTGLLLSGQAESYLAAHYQDETLSLETLCSHLHISPSYFSAVFKKETKKTFHQYLTEIRMDHAVKLLAAGEMRTAQVAQAVGIPDPSYFSYCFKKHFGYSPSSLRKQKEQP